MYDSDNNGYVDSKELRAVIPAMLQLLVTLIFSKSKAGNVIVKA